MIYDFSDLLLWISVIWIAFILFITFPIWFVPYLIYCWFIA